jgi:hypothetical protein
VTALAAAWILSQPAPYALGGDAETIRHPLFVDMHRQLAAGRMPLWTAGRWGGSPLLGDPIVGVMYPPYHLAYALTPFPHWRALDVSVVLHVALLVVGLVWLLARLDAPGGAAIACGALLLLNPTWVYVTRNWHEYFASLAWWPWLFGGALSLARGPRPGTAWLTTIALAAPVYAGYPEFALYAGIPALAWIPLAPGPARMRRLAVTLLVGLGAIALAAPQVLPGLAMAEGSIRLGPGGAELMEVVNRFFVLSPSTWLTVARPGPSWPAMPVKLAPAAIVLAFVGALDGRAATRWLAAAALASAFLATGPNPVYDTFHAIPPLSFFGAPLKLFYLANFLVAVLAGIGLGRLPTLRPTVVRAIIAGLALGAVPSLGAASPRSWLVGAAAAALAAAPRRLLAPATAVVAVASAVPFLVASRALDMPHAFKPGAFSELLRHPPEFRAAPGARALALGQARVLRQIGINFGSLWDVEAWNGTGDLVQWRQHAVLENAHRGAASALARQLGADPVIVEAKSALRTELEAAGFYVSGEAHGLVRLVAPAPAPARAVLVPRAKALPADVAIEIARNGRALDDRHVVIEGETLDGGGHGDPGGRVEVLAAEPTAQRLRVTVARPTWLLLRQPYYANWRATIGDRPATLRPAAGFLMALLVREGTHDVRIEYREPGLMLGAAVAALAIPILAFAFQRIGRAPGTPAPLPAAATA